MNINSYLASKGLTSGVQTDNGQIQPFQMPDWMLSGKAANPDEVFGMPQGRPVLYDSTGRVLTDAETWKVVADAGNTGTGKGGNADGQYGTAGALFNPWAAGQNEFQYGQTPAGFQIGSPDAASGNLGWYGSGLTPTYDPTYGWVVPNSPDIMKRQYDNYGNMVSNNQGNDFEAFMTNLPITMGLAVAGAGIGSALSSGGAAAGTGAATSGATAGTTAAATGVGTGASAGLLPSLGTTFGSALSLTPEVVASLQSLGYSAAEIAAAGGGGALASGGFAGGLAGAGSGYAASQVAPLVDGFSETSNYANMMADGSTANGLPPANAATMTPPTGPTPPTVAPSGLMAQQLVNMGVPVETANALATTYQVGSAGGTVANALSSGGGDAGVQTYGNPSITGAGGYDSAVGAAYGTGSFGNPAITGAGGISDYNLTPAQVQQAQSLGYSSGDIAGAGGASALANGGFYSSYGTPSSTGTGTDFFSLAKAAIGTPGVSQLLSGGLNALGGYLGSRAQAGAVNNANDLLWRQYQQNREDLTPYRMAGYGALGGLVDMTTPGKQLDRLRLDPGYDFRQSEGQKAIDSKLRAGGKFYSGPGIKAAADYNQNFASNEFNSAYNRLAGLAGTGQSAANSTAQLGQNTANTVANNTVDIGNARASGYGAIAGGLSGALNSYQNAQQTQQLFDLLRDNAKRA